jgi:HEAT repeat protein
MKLLKESAQDQSHSGLVRAGAFRGKYKYSHFFKSSQGLGNMRNKESYEILKEKINKDKDESRFVAITALAEVVPNNIIISS